MQRNDDDAGRIVGKGKNLVTAAGPSEDEACPFQRSNGLAAGGGGQRGAQAVPAITTFLITGAASAGIGSPRARR